ncbi:hypothetical protein [Actinophytocola xanthii]|uniref:DUF3995 domain-containing protein n=1 Tax=Actinophytocola xanthii TaxID=1912961 RepID=A0A1Q8CK54_9PSEU|nr:hypothetical protein [Actinophytocola xanthii]OLF14729.1 hypothetical protein BU204_25285 [Actinophytocola xanthii]
MRKYIEYLTAGFSFLYGLAGLYWAITGRAYPFGVGDPLMVDEGPDAIDANLLGLSTPEVAGPIIAVLGFLGGIVALLMARGVGRGGWRYALLVPACLYAVVLMFVIQDYRPLVIVAYTPILAVSKTFFGFPPDAGWGDLIQWPGANLTLLLLAGIGWAWTAMRYGRRGGELDLVRFGRPAVIVAVVVPLVYCVTRWAWALGWSVGLEEQMYREGVESGLWLGGAALATLGAGGALLTVGLLRPWGERFPRWMVGLAGKRVPINLAVVPATIVAVLVTSAGVMYIRLAVATGVEGKWVTNMPETLWPLWGLGLFVAALAYRQRRLATEKTAGGSAPGAAGVGGTPAAHAKPAGSSVR